MVCVDSDECQEGTVDPCADIEGSVCVNLQVDDNLSKQNSSKAAHCDYS